MKKKYKYIREIQIRRLKANFKKTIKRKKLQHRLKLGYEKFLDDVRKINPKTKIRGVPYHLFHKNSKLKKRPPYSDIIKYFLRVKKSFSPKNLTFKHNIFKIPVTFSLIENYEETSNFLKKFLNALHNQSFEKIFIDYTDCIKIDIEASMCMDVLLSDFIKYYKECTADKHQNKLKEIIPINYERLDIKKILFSIGAFRTIRNFKIDFDDIIPFPMIVGDKRDLNLPSKREVTITETVDYIIECLGVMERTLTSTAETNLYRVIGEVLQNADEHSDTSKRYSIGYFEYPKKANGNYGIFNLAIMNFGNTIYETFKSPKCMNKKVVAQMEDLSKKYTKSGWFKKAEFEEETLWTLYALQDGITRKEDWKRGNGSIRFIESFFNLKGNDACDNISKMVITSGNTQILFNGEYKTVEMPRGKKGELFTMMTFNETGNIEERPDPKFVKFEKNYFPGTLISVKIRIDFENSEKS